MRLHRLLCSSAAAALLVVGMGAHAAGTKSNSMQSVQTAPQNLVQADRLIGASVKNQANETVGDIEPVIIDDTGKVRALVVGVGGFLGVGERNVLVDWSKLSLHRNGNDVQLRMTTTADDLKKMPAYEPRS